MLPQLKTPKPYEQSNMGHFVKLFISVPEKSVTPKTQSSINSALLIQSFYHQLVSAIMWKLSSRVGQFHVQRPIWSTSDHDVVIVRGNLKFSIMKVVSSYFLHYYLIPKCGVGGRQQLIQYIL
ncbi:Hypothetical_protein [Hexamita inflata]|uniref:Hypothetical_protein n=1 Tax=Hexamita inflata TaxID=28002 RepID=A0ABP1IT05_9EUKA